MPNCIHLPLNYSKTESPNILNVSVIWDDEDLILVDCGNPNSLELLQDALKWNGLSLNKLTKIIITHHDYDHYGSLAELKEKYPNVKVYATQVEADYINGSKRSLRLVQAESIYPTLQDNQKEQAVAFHKKLESITPTQVDEILEIDGVKVSKLKRVPFYKALKLNQELKLTLRRNGDTIKINVILDKFLGKN